MEYQWVATAQQLVPIIGQLEQSTLNALDTEFIKVDTLYPKLGVLQINVNQQVYLIDGQLDLTPLWDSLFAAPLNVFHACGEDIDLIYHYAKLRPLSNVLDTQMAMAFLGYGRQLSYQAALEKILAIHVEKDQTRSEWLARPLSVQQERYAAIDVYYLRELAQRLIAELKEKKLYAFLQEDCQNYCAELAKQVTLEDAYLDVANFRHSPRQLMQLQQLAAWREMMAIRLNQPRSFILKNQIMQKLVERTPRTLHRLIADYELKPHILRQYGDEILKHLNELPDSAQYPQRLARPYRFRHEQTKYALEKKMQQVSEMLGIPVDVLMRKKWLNQLVNWVVGQKQDKMLLSPYLLGWRYEILTLPLLEIIRADVSVQSGVYES